MTFQIKGDVPEYLGDETPLGYTSQIFSVQVPKSLRDFTIDSHDDCSVPHELPLHEDIGFTQLISNEELSIYEVGSYRHRRPLKPHFTLKTQEKIRKLMRHPLKSSDMVKLIDKVCTISAEFYNIRRGKHIAVKIDGTIVESADSEIDLLLKIQGRQFGVPVFAHEVGAESTPGWST